MRSKEHHDEVNGFWKILYTTALLYVIKYFLNSWSTRIKVRLVGISNVDLKGNRLWNTQWMVDDKSGSGYVPAASTSKGCLLGQRAANRAENGYLQKSDKRDSWCWHRPTRTKPIEGMTKGNYDHNVTLGQIHVNEFHITKSDKLTPTLISDYKNEQSHILTDDPDSIKGKDV